MSLLWISPWRIVVSGNGGMQIDAGAPSRKVAAFTDFGIENLINLQRYDPTRLKRSDGDK